MKILRIVGVAICVAGLALLAAVLHSNALDLLTSKALRLAGVGALAAFGGALTVTLSYLRLHGPWTDHEGG